MDIQKELRYLANKVEPRHHVWETPRGKKLLSTHYTSALDKPCEYDLVFVRKKNC